MNIPNKRIKGNMTYLLLSNITDRFSEYMSYNMHCRQGINLETITVQEVLHDTN